VRATGARIRYYRARESVENRLSIREAMNVLPCGRTTIYEVLIPRGYLTPIRYGRRVRFRASQVLSLARKGWPGRRPPRRQGHPDS
jgi:excisionase family DNA binding protein